MTKEKGIITIFVPSNTTREEIKEIRQQFKNSSVYETYRLNIVISGRDDFKQNMTDFFKTRIFV